MVARALRRPLLLLFTNPVVSLLSVYLAMVSGYIVSRRQPPHPSTSNNSLLLKVHIPRDPPNGLQGQVRLLHKHRGARLHRPDGRVRSRRRPQRDRHGQDRHAPVRQGGRGRRPQAREPPRAHRLREPAHPGGLAPVRLVAAGGAALFRAHRRQRARRRGHGAHAGMSCVPPPPRDLPCSVLPAFLPPPQPPPHSCCLDAGGEFAERS